ncbi:MAG: DUF5054 domain-containing protein [Muribaculaceae bacterium]|nr:DUF5054 domain-containing protein [Muribaculaceae bacterium]
MKQKLIIYFTLLCVMLCAGARAASAEVNENIKRVYVLFKTHLDVGFTDLSSKVEKLYVEEYIPKAIDVAEQLRADGKGDRYVWTTGSWLIWRYLQGASPEEKARLDEAIGRGDIVWNGVPYTVETEVMTSELLDEVLKVAQRLDSKYGKHTIAAKMTDVPGHTRSIIAPLNRAGIKFLHVGVNPACPIPAVPPFCRWRDPQGNEVILVYQQDYGSDDVMPDGKTAISVNFTGDNHGPHSYDDVKRIYSNLRKKYPNAELVGASFNEVAAELLAQKEKLPVVTSEIGDTWIYGYGSAPIRMAKFRALTALLSQWLKDGRIDPEADSTLDFALELGLIAEHTQGMDIKTHLRNWDKYDMDKFIEARDSSAFRLVEESWREIDNYIGEAIKMLPDPLCGEALAAVAKVDTPTTFALPKTSRLDAPERFGMELLGGRVKLQGLIYQMLDKSDYDRFLDNYLRARYDWALCDLSKIGLENSSAVSASIPANVVKREIKRNGDKKITRSELEFAPQPGVDGRVFPARVLVETAEYASGDKAEVTLTILDKPAVRLPEAYWFSINAPGITSIVAEKTGAEVDLMDVVEKGNRQMHGIDSYIDLLTSKDKIRVHSDEAFLVNVGRGNGLDYSTSKPDISGGIHFNLSNNLWNTNFSMWNEGSLTYRFTIDLAEK